MIREWNSTEYHRLSDPQYGWGLKVLHKLQAMPLRDDIHILDAGCGTGRVTAGLLEAYPKSVVTAVDASENMVAGARESLAPFGARVNLRQQDLLELAEEQKYDVIFSTAVFHWIKDHDRLFAVLYRALKPGGLLLAQCGGGDNLLRLRTRAIAQTRLPQFAKYFENWERYWEFANAEVTAERLKRAGFTEIATSLEEAPTPLGDRETFKQFITHVNLQPYLKRLPEELQEAFIDPVVEQAAKDSPPFTLDYWRLNLQGKAISK
ncbi:MAG: methyltransferase domain-containing protein [Acidobacteriia bacterium]|nr:methyltransferase domain-containing protein [Terriglobia bacterium]